MHYECGGGEALTPLAFIPIYLLYTSTSCLFTHLFRLIAEIFLNTKIQRIKCLS